MIDERDKPMGWNDIMIDEKGMPEESPEGKCLGMLEPGVSPGVSPGVGLSCRQSPGHRPG